MKHTKGPWKTDGNGIVTGGPDFCTSICETPVILWRTGSGGTGIKNQLKQISVAQANAHLIAASPELLEALENLLDMVTDMRTHGPEIEAAADVIYKARGE